MLAKKDSSTSTPRSLTSPPPIDPRRVVSAGVDSPVSPEAGCPEAGWLSAGTATGSTTSRREERPGGWLRWDERRVDTRDELRVVDRFVMTGVESPDGCGWCRWCRW